MSPQSLLFDTVARQVFFSREKDYKKKKCYCESGGNDASNFTLPMPSPLANSPIKMTDFYHETHQQNTSHLMTAREIKVV